MVLLHSVSSFAPGLADRLNTLKADLDLRTRRYRTYRRVRDELDAMSDRDLTDIGIARGNIGDVARSAASEIRA